MFLLTRSCISSATFLSQIACHRALSHLLNLLPSLLPKLPNLVPNHQPRVQSNLLSRWQPSLRLESPF